MILTDEKIAVSHAMMQAANMTRGDQYGVPVDPANPVSGLRWKTMWQLTEADWNALEDYFLNRAKRA